MSGLRYFIFAFVIPVLCSCVSTGWIRERTATLSQVPDLDCMERVIASAVAPKAVNRSHIEKKNMFSGRIESVTESYSVTTTISGGRRDPLPALAFRFTVTTNRAPFQRLLGGSGDYRLFWGNWIAGTEYASAVHDIGLKVEESIITSCGASFSSGVRESTHTQSRAIDFNPI